MNPAEENWANAGYDAAHLSQRRKLLQSILAPITILVIALGWKYPILGFAVPVVMLTGICGAFINGRYVCGHLCPRGAFFDRIIAPISPKKHIPQALRHPVLRWTLVVVLMGFMIYRILQNPGSADHWGRVFWLMCVITTGAGVLLAIIHPRTWCALCPIGTIQASIGGDKGQLLIDSVLCRECKICEKACPIDLSIAMHKDGGVVAEPDCLRCPECIKVCPAKALSWPKAEQK
jgi:ferredoxin-type protein NapH